MLTLRPMHLQKMRNLFIICMVSVLMGQFYFSPFDTPFRLTFAVFFMSLFLIYFDDYSIMLITMSVGISTFLFRSAVNYVSGDLSFLEVLRVYYPVLTYYVLFGLMFKFLSVRSSYNQPINFFFSLWVCDSVANVMEAVVRRTWEIASFESLIVTIVIIGGIRTVMTLVAYYTVRYFHGKLKKQEQDKYYNELIFFVSKLQTELFFLNKSRADIESTVAFAHDYYNRMTYEEDKAPFLKIAKDVHEIKKDYLRVIAGMNAVFYVGGHPNYMSVSDLLCIVKDNIEKLAVDQGKKITIHTSFDVMFVTHQFYILISILNNLCVNSLDAMAVFGQITIKVSYLVDEKAIQFDVADTGVGISEEKKTLVFDVGYTTKYDKSTGRMSTGIGLSHVQQLVKEVLSGAIRLESEVGRGTLVTFIIPEPQLIKEGE